jgi:hypothetical protein
MASEKPLAEQRSISIGLLEKEAESSDSILNVGWGDLTKPVLTFDGRLCSTPGSPPILAHAFQFLNELPDSNGSTISSLADEYASDDEKYEAVEVALQSAQPIPPPFASAPFPSRGPGPAQCPMPVQSTGAAKTRPGSE